MGKRRATGLLVAVTIVFVVSTVLASRAPWLLWVQATAVASMVGGLADWFTVTALFRRPLGLPIPHTAIVVERKDHFAQTLGAFVQESFLTPDAVSERLRAGPPSPVWPDGSPIRRTPPAWPNAYPKRCRRGRSAPRRGCAPNWSPSAAGAWSVDLAALAGRALQQLTRNRRHEPIVDAALGGLSRYLDQHGQELRERLGVESPWWLPAPVEDRIVDRLLRQGRQVLADMAANREHPLRLQLDAGLSRLAAELQTSDDMLRRGEALKADLLGQSQLRSFATEVWGDVKNQLRSQAAEPASELQSRLAALVQAAGVRLRDDPELADRAQRTLDTAARLVLGRFDTELARLVSGTIDRWDAAETSRRLELLLGPDLQYIRINGTVVGAAAGLALHALSRAIG